MPKRPTDEPIDLLDFPKDCHRFLRQLEAHNDRAWFAEHRDEYHRLVLEPTRAFVRAAGSELKRFAPTVHADPRANGQGSISRIQRDARFSADKTPYRPFLGILFWQGLAERKWDSPGFHLVVQPGRVKLTAGIRVFSPAQLVRWRDWCRDDTLHRVVRKLERAGFEIGGSHYKRVPKDCEPVSELHGELLLHKGLFATHETKVKVGFCGGEFLAFCVETWRAMAGLCRWLEQLE